MPKPKLPTGQTVVWDTSKMKTVYANIMGFGMTPFDINLTLGQVGIATQDEVAAEAKVKLILAPEQAGNLIRLLQVALNTFEEKNGKLRTAGALDIEALDREMAEKLVRPREN